MISSRCMSCLCLRLHACACVKHFEMRVAFFMCTRGFGESGASKQWIKFNEMAQAQGPREEGTLLQDLALRSVKANASGWTETLLKRSKEFSKQGTKYLIETDEHLSRKISVDGILASAVYHGVSGLRADFRRAPRSEGEEEERLDNAILTLRHLSFGNVCAGEIWEFLQPRKKPAHIKYGIGDILCHNHYGWRGVVYGWSEKCELGSRWIQENKAENKAHHPFYNLLCNDGKMRYASELTHARVQGPLEFVHASPSSASAEEALDIKTARKYLNLYFHQFSSRHGAYIPNTHLARRFPEPRWTRLEEAPEPDLEVDEVM